MSISVPLFIGPKTTSPPVVAQLFQPRRLFSETERGGQIRCLTETKSTNRKDTNKMKTTVSNSSNSTLAVGSKDSDLIPGTTWSYFDAAAVTKEYNREARLFPKHRHPVSMSRQSSMTRSASFMAAFLKETGWSWPDAVEEAKTSRRRRHPKPISFRRA